MKRAAQIAQVMKMLLLMAVLFLYRIQAVVMNVVEIIHQLVAIQITCIRMKQVEAIYILVALIFVGCVVQVISE